MNYDFLIVGLPRSGTHMLATALNFHPDINCRCEDGQPLFGGVTGRVFTRLTNLPLADKFIVITRPWEERIQSWRTCGTEHLYEKRFANHLRGRTDSLPRCDHKLIEFAMAHHAYRVSYGDLTGGIDCRRIPDRIASEICDFLEVEYHPLEPRTYKPKT